LHDPPLVHKLIEMVRKIPEIDGDLAVEAGVVCSTADSVDKTTRICQKDPEKGFEKNCGNGPFINI